MEEAGQAKGKTAIVTSAAPAAIGPYSQAVRVGDMLFCSGQVPTDPKTGSFVPGGITEQATQVMENIKAIVTAAGLGLEDVVKATVYLTDLNDFAAMNEVYAKYLGGEGAILPARTTIQVAALPRKAMLEIDVILKTS